MYAAATPGWTRVAPLVIVIVGVLVGVVAAGRSTTVTDTSTVSLTMETLEGNQFVTVHVSGLVGSPGVISLPPASLVADAIAAAGGVLPGGDLTAINIARPVVDGEQIVVSGGTDERQRGSGNNEKVRLNQAASTELEKLPGVGPVLAERIVAFREQNGPFQTVEDLLDVPGIGEAKLASIRDLVTIP